MDSVKSYVNDNPKKAKKATEGRKKIEMKKIEQTNNRQVTFSKRRTGLFKKASELCILTGAEIAILVSSPGNRMFAFGHPNVDSVIDRYLTKEPRDREPEVAMVPALNDEFNKEYAELCKELEIEKKRNVAVEEEAKMMAESGDFWWDHPIDDLGLEDLKIYMSTLEELLRNVNMRGDDLKNIRNPSTASSSFDVNHVNFADQTTMNQAANDSTNGLLPFKYDFRHGQI